MADTLASPPPVAHWNSHLRSDVAVLQEKKGSHPPRASWRSHTNATPATPTIIVPRIIRTVHYLKSLATPETTRLSGQVKLSAPPKELMNPLHSYSPCAPAASNNSMDAPNMKRTAIIPPSSCSGPIDIVESLAARSPLHAVQIRSCVQKK